MPGEFTDAAGFMARLERLERRHQRLRLVCIGLAVLLGTSVLVAAQAPKDKSLEAERLVLRDRDGKVRADLNANGPYLKLFDEKGKVRAELFGSHLKLFDDQQTTRAELFGSHFKIFDGKGVTRVQLFGDHLKLFDSGGQTQVELNGSPSLRMFREKNLVYSAP